MPHIIIEHSANLADHVDVQGLVDLVHEAALADGLAAVPALRTRAASREHYRIADGDPSFGFVALTARVRPGRSAEERIRFLTALIDAVDERLAPLRDRLAVALSAEVQEIDAEFRINRNRVRTSIEERA